MGEGGVIFVFFQALLPMTVMSKSPCLYLSHKLFHFFNSSVLLRRKSARPAGRASGSLPRSLCHRFLNTFTG